MAAVTLVVGARPNFVKMAPVADALAERHPGIAQINFHTGQHYDKRLSQEVLDDLGFPPPEVFLEVGSGLHGQQTARVIERMESVLIERRPEALVVAGDVNSTLGCALAAAKLFVPVVHVESGLRSFDWSLPEEINTVIDSLRRFQAPARERAAWRRLGADERTYVLVTLRPSNVESPCQLQRIVTALVALSRRSPVIFPVHPRTQARMREAGLLEELAAGSVTLLAPLGYLDFLSLEAAAGAILTDSGGVQEEASALGVPCYTLRPNTERPVTLSLGTNVLLGDDPERIADIRIGEEPPSERPIPMWDGRAGERAADVSPSSFIRCRPSQSMCDPLHQGARGGMLFRCPRCRNGTVGNVERPCPACGAPLPRTSGVVDFVGDRAPAEERTYYDDEYAHADQEPAAPLADLGAFWHAPGNIFGRLLREHMGGLTGKRVVLLGNGASHGGTAFPARSPCRAGVLRPLARGGAGDPIALRGARRGASDHLRGHRRVRVALRGRQRGCRLRCGLRPPPVRSRRLPRGGFKSAGTWRTRGLRG